MHDALDAHISSGPWSRLAPQLSDRSRSAELTFAASASDADDFVITGASVPGFMVDETTIKLWAGAGTVCSFSYGEYLHTATLVVDRYLKVPLYTLSHFACSFILD